uniref:Uncharacterized protein n=1 Tax=Tetranychus urticae TaxID=32264 RepID=T1JQ85_TETUR
MMHIHPFLSTTKSFWQKSIVCASFFVSICGPVSCRKQEYLEPGELNLNRAFLQNNLSFITLACIWVFLLIIFVLFRIYYIDERNKLRQVFDDCSPSTSQFKYLVRLRVGLSSSNFQKETTAIMMDILDVKNRFITRISVSPSWLKSDVYNKQLDEKPRLVTLKFVLNRFTTMPAIGGVRLCHDSYFPVGGYIFIHSIDIRNFRENTVTVIPVLKRIFVLPPDAEEFDQVFKARSPGSAFKDSDVYIGGYSPFISFPEYLIFFFFYANVGLFTVMFKPTYLRITDLYQAATNGAFGFMTAFSITICIVVFYRYIIKTCYSRYRAMGPWAVVRIIFLTSIFLIAMIVGFTSSVIQSRYSSRALSYWSLAAVISDVLLAAVMIPAIAVRLLIKVKFSRSMGKLKSKSLISNMVDENKPPEQRTRIGVSTNTRSKSFRKELKADKKEESLKTDNKMEENIDEAGMQTIIRQKASIEEGLDLGAREKNDKSVRNRLLNRIQSVLRGTSKIKETEEDKFYAINKQLENKSNPPR